MCILLIVFNKNQGIILIRESHDKIELYHFCWCLNEDLVKLITFHCMWIVLEST